MSERNRQTPPERRAGPSAAVSERPSHPTAKAFVLVVVVGMLIVVLAMVSTFGPQ
jgi:hypothetical protein